MRRNSWRVFPVWLISAIAVAVMVCLIAGYLALRHPGPPATPPPTVVVSDCRDVAPGVRRIGRDLSIKFDIPVSRLAFDSGETGWSDRPNRQHYDIAFQDQSSITMRIEVWPYFNLNRNLQLAWPKFSERVEERDVRNAHGGVVGKDHWGVWNDGKRWRLVIFAGREEVGYLPTPAKEADLFDQVISSACFSTAQTR